MAPCCGARTGESAALPVHHVKAWVAGAVLLLALVACNDERATPGSSASAPSTTETVTPDPEPQPEPSPEVVADFRSVMDDDFDTPGAVDLMFRQVREANGALDGRAHWNGLDAQPRSR